MSFSDETLMAFADGELDSKTRAAIEAAMESDAAVARRVAQHLALRSRVFTAYAPILDEPVPERLSGPFKGAAKPRAAAQVIELAAVRAARMPVKAPPPRHWGWQEWLALGATLVGGVVLGYAGLPGSPAVRADRDSAQAAPVASVNGQLTAQGPLAQALSAQLASAQPADAKVKIGVSFRAKGGQFCRSFATDNLSGLACRDPDDGNAWRLPLVIESGAAQPVRPADAQMPDAILQAINARIDGQSLDAAAERQAVARRWRP
jgi:anti-sigma factor RsiW